MNSIRFYLDNLWRWKCGLPEVDSLPTPAEIIKSKRSTHFDQLRNNRLVMGTLRYEINKSLGEIRRHDRVGSSIKRLEKYLETGNLEHLVDVCNMCELEYLLSIHPNKHWHASDDKFHMVSKEN